jgi:hypothetical protein
VIEERIEAWKANWKRKIMLRRAAGQAQRLRLVEHARAQAQVDVIVDIGERIEALRSDGGPVPMDRVAGYFIGVLEKVAREQTTRRLLPRDIDDVIGRARDTIGMEESTQQAEGGGDA